MTYKDVIAVITRIASGPIHNGQETETSSDLSPLPHRGSFHSQCATSQSRLCLATCDLGEIGIQPYAIKQRVRLYTLFFSVPPTRFY